MTEPQAEFYQLRDKFPAFIGGYGCVAADTLIFTEVGLLRIDQIDRPMRVLSWSEQDQKFRLSLTGGSYPKGRANLRRVVTQQGEFVASAHHRVLDGACRYRCVDELAAGHSVAVCSPAQPLSVPALIQQELFEGAYRWTQTDVDLMARYAESARRYGRQFLGAQGSGQAVAPSRVDAQACGRNSSSATCGNVDGCEEHSPRRSRCDQSGDPRPSSYSQHQVELLELSAALHDDGIRSAHVLDGSQQSQQFREQIAFHQQGSKSVVEVGSCCTLSKAVIIAVEPAEEAVYWDMQVLDTNNYVSMDGAIHHNSGKTKTLTDAAFRDALEAPSAMIAMYEPTYDLVRLILAPRMEDMLIEQGMRYKYNKTENIIYVSSAQCGDFVMRTLENPARIVGYESYRAHIDEIDILTAELAETAWNKIIARNRQRPRGVKEPTNRISVYSTPEGYKFVYNRWAKDAKPGYVMVKAPTRSNPFLPDDYEDDLRTTYSPQLVKAYLNGDFVNMTAGSVYPDFDRRLNHSNAMLQPFEPVHIGMDFNVLKMTAIVSVIRDGQPITVDELTKVRDTPTMARLLAERYHQERHPITIYPDASGGNTSSKDASESDLSILRQAGFVVRNNPANPSVKDRVNSVNAMVLNGKGERRWLVNTDRCPTLTAALEQQPYDKHGEPEKGTDLDHPNDAAGYFIWNRWPVAKRTTRVVPLAA